MTRLFFVLIPIFSCFSVNGFTTNFSVSLLYPTPSVDAGTLHPGTSESAFKIRIPNAKLKTQNSKLQTPLSVEIESIAPVSCHGGADGAIYLTVEGGNEPFKFEWSTGAGDQNLTAVPAGTYSVTITDADDTQVVLSSILVEQPAAPLALSFSQVQHINCLNPLGALTVQATGGTPAYQYLWNIGQTSASVNQLPSGSFTVTVTDANGCTAALSQVIQQDLTPPFAQAGAPQNLLCSNTATQLNGNGSAGPLFSYQWTASGGGNIVSGGNTLSPTVNNTGTYTLTVTNTQNGCTATSSTSIGSQFMAPAATAGGGVLNCVNFSVTLQATYGANNTIYGWTGPNGFVSQLLHPTVSAGGTYIFTVTDTITTCSTRVNALVSTDATPPAVSASAGNSISCLTPTSTLTATSNLPTAVFQWSGPNNFKSNDPIVAVSAPGTYTITATNPQNGCASSALVTVSGNTTPPAVTATANGKLTCVILSVQLAGTVQPAGATFQWTGPNNFKSSQLNPFVNVAGVYTLTATNPQNGCTATASATVVLDNMAPTLSATGGVITCANPSISLKANSNTPGATFQWTGPNGFNSPQQNPLVSATGFYTVVAANPANGCTNSAGVSVTANLINPLLLTTNSTITCASPLGKPTASSTTQGVTFAWTGPNGATYTGSNPQVNAPGFYTVVATNPVNGCTAISTSVLVTDNTTPPMAFAGETAPMINCFNAPVQLNGSGSSFGNNITYLWTTYDGNIISGMFGLFPRVNAAGTYTLKVTNTQNGCVALDSIEVLKAPPVTALINQVVPVACNGTATGSATVKAGGGNGTYTYAWSTGANTATATGLAAGMYTVTVSDSDGCTAGDVVLINQPTALQAIVSATPQTKVGVNNGTAGVSPTGGTSPYTVKWSNNATTLNIINLAPGTYTVTVTDNRGCTLVRTATVNAVNCNMGGSIAATQISCSGAANGSATANITGGVAPVTYKWSNNATTQTISNLGPGTYTVTATDVNGCTIALNAAITSPAPLSLVFAAQENVPCPGSKTGLLTAGVSGGTTPYTFAWSTGANTAGITGLGTGSYTVTVTDARGCSRSLNAQIVINDQNPPQLVLKNATIELGANGTTTLTAALFDNGSFDAECSIASWTLSPASVDCAQLGARTITLTATDANGNSKTGTAIATVIDKIAPAVFCPENQTVGACSPAVQYTLPNVTDNCAFDPARLVLKNGLPSNAVFPVGKTTQTYTYTDAAGNSGECSFDITVDPLPDGTLSLIPASCPGSCNGAAIFTLTDGNVPASGIMWDNGQTGAQIDGLCPATYSVTLRDVHGCTGVLPFLILNANTSSFEISAGADPASCTASCDGAAWVTIGGASGPYDISWSNGVSGAGINNICAGPYTATVTDANGCTQVQAFDISVVDNVAPVLLCPANITTSTCAATLAYNPPGIQDNCPTVPQQLQLLEGLPSGSAFPVGTTLQRFRYTDAAGNSGECSFTVQVLGQPAISISATGVSCAGACNGLATLSVTGGYGPFSVQWSDGQTGLSVTNLCAGAYMATVTDAAGCKQTAQTMIQTPAPLNVSLLQLINDSGNAGLGSIQINVSGGVQPYTFSWTRNGQFFAATQNLANLTAGQYAVQVTDANGCVLLNNPFVLSNTVAAHEAPWASGLRLYPNPASQYVQLTLAEPLGLEAEVRLVAANGALYRSERLPAAGTTLRFDVSDLPPGFWLLQIQAEDGSVVVRKVVVER